MFLSLSVKVLSFLAFPSQGSYVCTCNEFVSVLVSGFDWRIILRLSEATETGKIISVMVGSEALETAIRCHCWVRLGSVENNLWKLDQQTDDGP